MSRTPLTDLIRAAVEEERYEVTIHADNRIEDRGGYEWHFVAGLSDCRVIREHPKARPWPSVLVEHALPDGAKVRVKWSYRAPTGTARLVTFFYVG